jgi:hypothetical protein
MAKRRKDPPFKLPAPPKGRIGPKPERCDDCKEILEIGKGYGFCLSCHQTTPLPVGRIVSKGPCRGKLVYLKTSMVRELVEDYGENYKEGLEVELKAKGYVIIEEIES